MDTKQNTKVSVPFNMYHYKYRVHLWRDGTLYYPSWKSNKKVYNKKSPFNQLCIVNPTTRRFSFWFDLYI